ncbi:hypothetical protein E2C01_098826 [Portunus trituberculatus]|uniref:Uncharacterized protein n=1 Tax=Portunus trituberculatus TaxID=210409 RepID=A0A5B7K278_PORTR|nr:hypothetical protein [Portunus trituberculatus]
MCIPHPVVYTNPATQGVQILVTDGSYGR